MTESSEGVVRALTAGNEVSVIAEQLLEMEEPDQTNTLELLSVIYRMRIKTRKAVLQCLAK